MKLLKIILVVSLPLFLILGCKKSDDSSTSTSTSTCTVSYTAVGKVGDVSSNLVTAALVKSASFTKGLTVFGIILLETSGVSDAKLIHAANVTAELLDDDENGTVDNLCVVAKLNDLSTYVTMYNTDPPRI
jgi:pyridoxal/pyridoxine/pyridoxamine kinase